MCSWSIVKAKISGSRRRRFATLEDWCWPLVAVVGKEWSGRDSRMLVLWRSEAVNESPIYKCRKRRAEGGKKGAKGGA